MSIKILSGAFGKGFASFIRGKLEISPESMFSGDITVPGYSIKHIEIISSHLKKKTGETVGLSTAGLVFGAALGPIGSVAGMALGALAGGKRDIVTFLCRLDDGKSFSASAPAEVYAEILTEVYRNRSIEEELTPDDDDESLQDTVKSAPKRKRRNKKSKSNESIGMLSASVQPPEVMPNFGEPPAMDCNTFQAIETALKGVEANSTEKPTFESLRLEILQTHDWQWRQTGKMMDDAAVVDVWRNKIKNLASRISEQRQILNAQTSELEKRKSEHKELKRRWFGGRQERQEIEQIVANLTSQTNAVRGDIEESLLSLKALMKLNDRIGNIDLDEQLQRLLQQLG